MRVLVVEDDDGVADELKTALEYRGHTVTRVSRAQDALRYLDTAEFVLLDLRLENNDPQDGLKLLRQLRAIYDTPVIVLTASECDVAAALAAGADDYMRKPCNSRELFARIYAVRRTAKRGGPFRPPVIRLVRVCDVEIDLARRSVTVAGTEVALTSKEFGVLAFLAEWPGEARSREEILNKVWSDTHIGPGRSRSLDVHVSKIRTKTGRPSLIHTVHGFGYQLGTAAGEQKGSG